MINLAPTAAPTRQAPQTSAPAGMPTGNESTFESIFGQAVASLRQNPPQPLTGKVPPTLPSEKSDLNKPVRAEDGLSKPQATDNHMSVSGQGETTNDGSASSVKSPDTEPPLTTVKNSKKPEDQTPLQTGQPGTVETNGAIVYLVNNPTRTLSADTEITDGASAKGAVIDAPANRRDRLQPLSTSAAAGSQAVTDSSAMAGTAAPSSNLPEEDRRDRPQTLTPSAAAIAQAPTEDTPGVGKAAPSSNLPETAADTTIADDTATAAIQPVPPVPGKDTSSIKQASSLLAKNSVFNPKTDQFGSTEGIAPRAAAAATADTVGSDGLHTRIKTTVKNALLETQAAVASVGQKTATVASSAEPQTTLSASVSMTSPLPNPTATGNDTGVIKAAVTASATASGPNSPPTTKGGVKSHQGLPSLATAVASELSDTTGSRAATAELFKITGKEPAAKATDLDPVQASPATPATTGQIAVAPAGAGILSAIFSQSQPDNPLKPQATGEQLPQKLQELLAANQSGNVVITAKSRGPTGLPGLDHPLAALQVTTPVTEAAITAQSETQQAGAASFMTGLNQLTDLKKAAASEQGKQNSATNSHHHQVGKEQLTGLKTEQQQTGDNSSRQQQPGKQETTGGMPFTSTSQLPASSTTSDQAITFSMASHGIMSQQPTPTAPVSAPQQPAMPHSAAPFYEESVLNQVSQRMQMQLSSRQTQLNIKLQPTELGRLDINLTMKEGAIRAHVVAQSGHVRELLEKNMSRLKGLLADQGIDIEEIQVTTKSENIDNSEMFQQTLAEEKAAAGQGRRTSDTSFGDAFEGMVNTFAAPAAGLNITA